MPGLKVTFVLILLLIASNWLFSQQLKLGKLPYQVEKSAVLELHSDNQGLLYPRIGDTASINSLNPLDGTVIYFTPLKKLMLRTGGYWQALTIASDLPGYWALNGNTNGARKTIGNKDNYGLAILTNNLERIKVEANGNVGIGTAAAPTQRLELTGNFRLTGAFMPGNTAGVTGAILISAGANASPVWIDPVSYLETMSWLQGGNNPTANKTFGTTTNYAIQFITNNTEQMRLTNTGSLGIGVTSPGNILEVKSVNPLNGNSGLRLQGFGTAVPNAATAKLLSVDGNGDITVAENPGFFSWRRGGNLVNAAEAIGTTSNFHLPFITNNSERMRLTSSGFLGIATTNPGNFLEVGGSSTFTSGLRLNGLGAATPTASNGKILSVNANGDIIVTTAPLVTQWAIQGNAGIDAANHFLGTTDDRPLILKSNNSKYFELGRRQTLGLIQSYADYTDANEQVLHLFAPIQWHAPGASFYKPKMYVNPDGNFRLKGSAAGTDFFEMGATGTANNGAFEFIIGDDGDEPILFKSFNHATAEFTEMMRLQNGSMAVGSANFNVSNREKLLVDAGTTSSYNLISAKGNINNYLQLNIQNQSAGNTASSDIVATANNGDEQVNFVNLGINSSGFTNTAHPIIGGINNAYLYSTGNDFIIGNGTAARNLRFFTGGFAAANERLRIDPNGNIGIGNLAPTQRLDVTGNIRFSGALMPNNNAGTAGMVLTSAGAGNAPVWSTVTGSGWATGGNAVTSLTNFGTTTNYDISFITNNTEAMRLTTGNRLGIGTSAPAEALDVNGNIRINGGSRRLIFGNMGGDPDAVIQYRTFANTEANELFFYVGNDVAGTWGPDRVRMVAEEFRFQTFNNSANNTLANAEAGLLAVNRFLIDGAGNIGINNGAPTEKLDVTGNIKFSGALMPNGNAGAAGHFLRSNGAGAAPSWVDVSAMVPNSWNIGGNWLSGISNFGSNSNTDIQFITNGANRLYIQAGGNIGIGMNNPGFRLHVNGDFAAQTGITVDQSGSNNGTLNSGASLRFGNGSGEGIASSRSGSTNVNGLDFYTAYIRRMWIGNGGNVSFTHSILPANDAISSNQISLGASGYRWYAVHAAIGVIQTSDRRQKKNIQDLNYGLKEVLKLQPVRYNWISDSSNKSNLGLIAQDVRAVIPEVVSGDESKETLGMNYAELVPVLINAIREQQLQIDELKKQVGELQKK